MRGDGENFTGKAVIFLPPTACNRNVSILAISFRVDIAVASSVFRFVVEYLVVPSRFIFTSIVILIGRGFFIFFATEN